MPKEENKKHGDVHSLEDVQSLLREDIISCKDFEKSILGELREIQHLEANIKVIIQQIESIRKLFDTREEILKRLIREKRVARDEIDINNCKEYLMMILEIDKELQPMTESVYQELKKLQVNETHRLYVESQENRDFMHKIDEQVRNFVDEVLSIMEANAASEKHIKEMNEHIQNIEKKDKNDDSSEEQ